jgi:transcription initiation factor TFIID TATA-box-binding protein
MRIRIENVVASTSLGLELDLITIAFQLDGAEYDPAQFPGLIYRMKDPKTAILLFHSGKVVCTGGKSSSQVERSIATISAQLRKGGTKVERNPKIEIQNIVATSDLGSELDLNIVAVTLGLDRVEYEPEQFPGLVYRINEPRVVLLLFSSGKMVCTGARRPRDLALAVEKIRHELQSAGLLSQHESTERRAAPAVAPRRRATPILPDVPILPEDLEVLESPVTLDVST